MRLGGGNVDAPPAEPAGRRGQRGDAVEVDYQVAGLGVLGDQPLGPTGIGGQGPQRWSRAASGHGLARQDVRVQVGDEAAVRRWTSNGKGKGRRRDVGHGGAPRSARESVNCSHLTNAFFGALTEHRNPEFVRRYDRQAG